MEQHTDSPSAATPRFTLRRSRTDRKLGGVCGGLAASLGADANLLRVLAVVLTVLTHGVAAVVYLAAWALAPETPAPGTPAPGTPAPGTPAPGTPAPEEQPAT